MNKIADNKNKWESSIENMNSDIQINIKIKKVFLEEKSAIVKLGLVIK